MLQYIRVHFGVPKVGNQRLQRPEGIQHIPLLQFLLQLQLFGGGLLVEVGHVKAHDEVLLGVLFLQGNEPCGARVQPLQDLQHAGGYDRHAGARHCRYSGGDDQGAQEGSFSFFVTLRNPTTLPVQICRRCGCGAGGDG